MNYTISDENIIIFKDGIINIPKDDLRYIPLKKNLLNNNYNNVELFLNLEKVLPKGYQVIEDSIFINSIKISDKIIFNNKDQLEELKNHIYDFYKGSDLSYLENIIFLDKQGEVYLKNTEKNLVNIFRKKSTKEQESIKKIIKNKGEMFLPLIKYFSSDEINNLVRLDLKEHTNILIEFYLYYFNKKNSKFFKAINNSNLSITEWNRLLTLFKHKPIPYKTKLTNLNILLKKYEYSTKNFKNDFPTLYINYKKYYDNLDKKNFNGYVFNLAKHRDDLTFLGQKFNNCLASRSNEFLKGNKLVFTIKYKNLHFVSEIYPHSNKIGDFESLGKINNIDYHQKSVQEIINKIMK